MRVLFVCRRNAGRSQIAAAIARGRYPQIEVRSGGVDPDLGGPGVPADVQLVIGELGGHIYPLARRRLITPDDLEWADRVVMIVEAEHWPDWFQHQRIDTWDVADPRLQPMDVLRACANELSDRVDALLSPLS